MVGRNKLTSTVFLALVLALLTWALIQAAEVGERIGEVEKFTHAQEAQVPKSPLRRMVEVALICRALEEVAREQYRASWSGQVAARIDAYLTRRGSPLAGYGYVFAEEAERTGINPYLPVAIAGKESSFGLRCFSPHNAWGMLAYPRGFGTWEEGIRANFAWLQRYYGKPQSAYDCRGYCVPDQPWMREVEAVVQEISGS